MHSKQIPTFMRRPLLAATAVLALSACGADLNVPDLNAPVAGSDVTRSIVITNAQGLLVSVRDLTAQGIRPQGVWGRESYDLRPPEPRPYTDNLIGPRDPNSFNNIYFTTNYGAITDANSLLNSVDALGESMTAAEKESIRGWAKTVKAFAYYQLAVHHPGFGAPLEPPPNPLDTLSRIASQAELFDRSIALFDEAAAHLQAAGGSFPFQLTPGYEPFTTPASFLQVNRALKARTLKYMGRWSDVLAALDDSFVDASEPMRLGAYSSYSVADGTNPFFAGGFDYIHPRIRNEAQQRPDGTLDARAVTKTTTIAPFTLFGVTVTEKPNVYPTATSPLPWIRNEELLLIRAEANLALGNSAAALADVNVVRQESGGLAPIASLPGNDALLDEILYNKRYSLLFEGGFTYIDAFQYDRLDELPRALPAHVVFTRLNWPASECLQRGLTDGPCGTVVGLP